MAEEVLEIEMRGAATWVWMNRPAVHNALNDGLIRALTKAFRTLGEDASVRVIVLTGRGKSFSAGADVESMKQQGAASPVENLASARELADMFHSIAACPKPAVARVNGAAIGGGLGLVSACDIAIASNAALFAASEVRLGLIPATIGPYVVQAIGARWARRLFQTAERISATLAEKIGLVHEAVDSEKLDERIQAVIDNLLAGAPSAQKAAKDLINAVANHPMTPELMEETAVTIAHIRATDEAKEGLSAFLEKRPAFWVPQR